MVSNNKTTIKTKMKIRTKIKYINITKNNIKAKYKVN